MSVINYVSVDRIFSKISRDLKGTEIPEDDVIEWIGEALDFLKVPQILEEDVRFLKVKDYHTDMPANLHMLTQIARNVSLITPNTEEEATPVAETTDACPVDEVLEVTDFHTISNEDTPLDNLPADYANAFLNAQATQEIEAENFNALDLDWTYTVWTTSDYYNRNFVPVRLATGTFFNSIVCKEKDEALYNSCTNEYTIVGMTEKKLRFNFIEGQVAVSYLKNCVDKETGYPLIPDNISYITAIVYYLKWKVAEMNEWAGRDGWAAKAEKAEIRWGKYAKQAKNYMKMPKTLDQYQNLLEQTHYLIPNHNKYYGFFGNLGKNPPRTFHKLNRAE